MSKRYGHRWRKLSESVRHMMPYCEKCFAEGKIVTEDYTRLQVDHIVPIEVDPDREFDTGNLQVLCQSCHSEKTARENSHWNNHELRKPKQWWMADFDSDDIED